MLGLRAAPPLISLSPSQKSPILPIQKPNFNSIKFPQFQNPKRFRISAQSNNGEDKKEKNERPRLNFKWVDLVLDPNPDNIVAVGLTGLLTWASVQVLWQIFIVASAIVVAALKYTLVAALLIFILITLL